MSVSTLSDLGGTFSLYPADEDRPISQYHIWWFGDRHADVALLGMIHGEWHGWPSTYFLFSVHFNKSQVPQFDLEAFCCRSAKRFYGHPCLYKWKWKGPVPGVATKPPGGGKHRDRVHYYAFIIGGPRHYRLDRKLTTRRFWSPIPEVTRSSAFRLTDPMEFRQPLVAIFHDLHAKSSDAYKENWESKHMCVSHMLYYNGEVPEDCYTASDYSNEESPVLLPEHLAHGTNEWTDGEPHRNNRLREQAGPQTLTLSVAESTRPPSPDLSPEREPSVVEPQIPVRPPPRPSSLDEDIRTGRVRVPFWLQTHWAWKAISEAREREAARALQEDTHSSDETITPQRAARHREPTKREASSTADVNGVASAFSSEGQAQAAHSNEVAGERRNGSSRSQGQERASSRGGNRTAHTCTTTRTEPSTAGGEPGGLSRRDRPTARHGSTEPLLGTEPGQPRLQTAHARRRAIELSVDVAAAENYGIRERQRLERQSHEHHGHEHQDPERQNRFARGGNRESQHYATRHSVERTCAECQRNALILGSTWPGTRPPRIRFTPPPSDSGESANLWQSFRALMKF